MKKSNHGGAREGAGRPATIEDAVPRRTIEALDSAALRADSDRPSIARRVLADHSTGHIHGLARRHHVAVLLPSHRAALHFLPLTLSGV